MKGQKRQKFSPNTLGHGGARVGEVVNFRAGHCVRLGVHNVGWPLSLRLSWERKSM
jgi:hypothetical protein